jgi:hypothetical protein
VVRQQVPQRLHIDASTIQGRVEAAPTPADTVLYRIHKPKWLVVAVVTLLAHGCPVQAIVAAFELDERTVARSGKENPERTASGYTSTL